jgi:O-antigen/teichoic acid export membrane protein
MSQPTRASEERRRRLAEDEPVTAPNIGRFARHSLVYSLARGVPGLVNFGALAVYTRLLEPSEFGRYVLVIAWVNLAKVLCFQWLRLSILRFLPGYANDRGSFLGALLWGFLVTGGIATLLGLVAMGALSPSSRTLLILGLSLLWAQGWLELNLEMLRIQLQPARYGALLTSRAVLALMGGTALAALGYGASGVLLGTAVGMALPGTRAMRRDWRGTSMRNPDIVLLRRIAVYGLPLTVAFAFSYVVSTSDRLLLGWLAGADAAGLYAAGYDLAQTAVLGLLLPISLASFPLAVQAMESGGPEEAATEMTRNLIMLSAVGLPAAAGLAILAPNITHVLLGARFRGTAVQVLPWIAFAGLCIALVELHFNRAFQLSKQTGRQLYPYGAAAILNIVLNIYLIPRFAVMGAVYATMCAYVVAVALAWWMGRYVFVMPIPARPLGRIAGATIGMTAILSPMRNWLGVAPLCAQVAVGALSYVIFLGLFHASARPKQLYFRLLAAQ